MRKFNPDAPKRDIIQEVTDRIIADLEKGNVPWLRPWKDSSAGAINQPHNAETGRVYNGVNWLVLNTMPYASQGWLTFKQAKRLGGSVRKGETGTGIVYWAFPKRRDEKTGEYKVVPFAKAYTVFNIEQCEGLDLSKIKQPTPVVAAAGLVADLAAKHGIALRHGGNRAFFSPMGDFVQLPSRDAFKSDDHYQSTGLHEFTHWSGHQSRLAREFGKRFGDEAYAFEELVAEMGSAFLCARLGVALEGLQHSDYIANWLRVLKNDKRAILTAAKHAKAATEFLAPEADNDDDSEESENEVAA